MRDVAARVVEVASAIPAGRVTTYGAIARAVGIDPRQAGRLVGRVADEIPWWRVVRSDGTPAGCHGGIAPVLLASEGVAFTGARVDLGVSSHAL